MTEKYAKSNSSFKFRETAEKTSSAIFRDSPF